MGTTRTETVRARISPSLKRSAEGILSALGMSPSQAIVLFYKQIELHNGLPFDLRLTPAQLPDVSSMSEDEFNAELKKGVDSAVSGNTRSVSEARTDFRRRHAAWKNMHSR